MKIHIKISEAALNKDNYENEAKKFYSDFEKIADSVSIEKVVPLWKALGTKNSSINKYGDKISNIDYCPLLFYKLVVATNGDIYPCTNLPPQIKLGNIFSTTLQDAWCGSERAKLLKGHLLHTYHHKAPCKQCYIPINTVVSSQDIIDPYKDEILKRLEKYLGND